ncbi:MAG: BtpA/SgcQ family protein, partial [Phycisphaerales bacterium]
MRVENFVFSHVADEGLMIEACAGPLLRHRRAIGADRVRVFADIKKKHASHAVTADVDIAGCARAAEFFLADGVIVTGTETGASVDEFVSLQDLPELSHRPESVIARDDLDHPIQRFVVLDRSRV